MGVESIDWQEGELNPLDRHRLIRHLVGMEVDRIDPIDRPTPA
jgi:hypothetical protein